jgi:hypothetical protein
LSAVIKTETASDVSLGHVPKPPEIVNKTDGKIDDYYSISIVKNEVYKLLWNSPDAED